MPVPSWLPTVCIVARVVLFDEAVHIHVMSAAGSLRRGASVSMIHEVIDRLKHIFTWRSKQQKHGESGNVYGRAREKE